MSNKSGPEKSLEKLRQELDPILSPNAYVFITVPSARYGDLAGLEPWAMVNEAEGMTFIIERQRARDADLPDQPAYRCITLQVWSDLEAVGLTAAVSDLLANAGIPANMVAGFHHDHLFLPEARAVEALTLLESWSQSQAG